MTAKRFVYIWKYRVSPDHRLEFLSAYGPAGDWARLFSRDSSYLGTRLLQDAAGDNRFATIDYWVSQADRDSFKERYAKEFDDLDKRCEEFTLHEEFVGDYIEMDDSST